MASEVEEIGEKWSWIFKNLQRWSRGMHSAWQWCGDWNRAVHDNLLSKHPRFTKVAGGLLRFIYGIVTHAAFAVVLALLLVGFVISGAITIIVSVSVFFAWLITVLWLAHSEPVKNLNILPRIVVVIFVALCAASAANWYGKWCLGNYALNQTKDKAASPASEQKSENQQLLTALDKAVSEQLKKLTPKSTTRPNYRRTNQSQLPTVIETAPNYGNLSDRATTLSNEIRQDLSFAPPMPPLTKPDQVEQWRQSRSRHFMFMLFKSVVDIRDEFAQLHLRDQKLDQLIDEAQKMEEYSKRIMVINPKMQILVFAPTEIEEVAERLNVLAKQARQRDSPKPLSFSVTHIQPQSPQFPFDTVVTITTNAVLSRGYVVTEFSEMPTHVATDVKDGKVVFGSDVEGNRPLKDYLSTGESVQLYALELGKTPFRPNQPMHVFAHSLATHGVTTPVNVIKVTWFDE